MANDLYDVLDLKALRCFWSMARHLSLTKAGVELGISEAAVSQRVKALETYLGAKLYEVRGGHVRLTSAGTQALDMAIALFDHAEALQSAVLTEHAAGSISIAAAEPVLRYVLPDIIEHLAEQHPAIDVRLLSRHDWECVELVRRNEADMGLISERELPQNLVFHSWRTFGACLIMKPDHPLLAKGRPQLRQLLNRDTVDRYPLVSTEADDPDDERLQQTLKHEGLPYNVRLHVGNLDTVKHYVARGLGVAVVPAVSLTDEDRGRIEMLEIPEEFHGNTTYGVVLRRDKHLAPALRVILGLLEIDIQTD